MTYAEATRQGEEDARYIRNAKVELEKRAERLAKCQAIISAALTVEVVMPPDSPPPVDNVVALMDPVPVAFEGEDAA